MRGENVNGAYGWERALELDAVSFGGKYFSRLWEGREEAVGFVVDGCLLWLLLQAWHMCERPLRHLITIGI